MDNSSANFSEELSAAQSVASSILERAKADDASAWKRLVTLIGPDVYQWCRRAGLSDEDTEDVVQEVFLWVRRSLHLFHRDEPGDTFRGWLWTITRNAVRDAWARAAGRPEAIGGSDHKRRLEQLASPPQELPDKSAMIGDDRAVVRRALNAIRKDFSTQAWQAFWRTAIDDRLSAEVAEELSMTKNAVRQAKCRVMRRLREELDGLVDL